MSLLDSLIGILAPHQCLGCDSEGALLCKSCIGLLPDVPERCYRCRKYSPGSFTCKGCRKTSRLSRVLVATDYEGVSQRLVWKLKFAGAQAAIKEISTSMFPLLASFDAGETIVVPVPTATNRIRQRGYDQAELLARELSRRSGIPYMNCLRRQGQTKQMGASRQVRRKQVANAFRVRKQITGRNMRVIMIDDVLTTGATLESAARTLQVAGVRQIDALVFAQP